MVNEELCKPTYFHNKVMKLFNNCGALMKSKNKDYNNSEYPFHNFERVEQLGICSTEKGILVRMNDKFSRICNLIDKNPAVADEKIEDTLIDLINYSAILLIYIKQKKKSDKNAHN
jgi:hypothetical protein